MKKIREEKGLLSLEASVSLTIFLFLMLFMYSFFVVFEARNVMAHTLLSTTKSMSLDTYANKKFGQKDDAAAVIYNIYGMVKADNQDFASTQPWHDEKKLGIDETTWNGAIYVPSSDGSVSQPDEFGNVSAESPLLLDTIEKRFIAYLSGGDEAEASKLLEKYHVVNGVDGLDFSGSYIKSGKLYIKLRYQLEYEFNAFGLGIVEFEQSACSKLW